MDTQLLLVIPSLLIFYGCYHLLLAALIFVFGYRDKKQGITIGLDDDQNFSVTQTYGDMSAKCQLHVPNIPGWIRGACSQVKAAYKLYAPMVPGTEFKPCNDRVHNIISAKANDYNLFKLSNVPLKNNEFIVQVLQCMKSATTCTVSFTSIKCINKNYLNYPYKEASEKLHRTFEVSNEHFLDALDNFKNSRLTPEENYDTNFRTEHVRINKNKVAEELQLKTTLMQKLWLADVMFNDCALFKILNDWCKPVNLMKYNSKLRLGGRYNDKDSEEIVRAELKKLFENPSTTQMFPGLNVIFYPNMQEHGPIEQWNQLFHYVLDDVRCKFLQQDMDTFLLRDNKKKNKPRKL